MALIKEIDQAFMVAMREKREPELSVLRMLRAALQNKSKEAKKDLDDKEVVTIIKSETKKRKESIETYEQASRPELAAQEKAELEILEKYLPAQLDEAGVKAKVDEVLANVLDDEKENFGVVMKKVMAELQGTADGGLVSKVLRETMQK